MSKYCPMCNAYTNCTDNCNTCIEEANKMKNFIDRIHAEQKEYLDYIATLSPKEIIEKAYEICYRNEFVCILESTMFDDETMVVLMNTPHILDLLYDEWLKTDASVCDILEDVIRDFAQEELK